MPSEKPVEEPEFVEILDKNGTIIYGMKRNKVIPVNSETSEATDIPSDSGLETFLEDVESKDYTIRELLKEATSELVSEL